MFVVVLMRFDDRCLRLLCCCFCFANCLFGCAFVCMCFVFVGVCVLTFGCCCVSCCFCSGLCAFFLKKKFFCVLIGVCVRCIVWSLCVFALCVLSCDCLLLFVCSRLFVF